MDRHPAAPPSPSRRCRQALLALACSAGLFLTLALVIGGAAAWIVASRGAPPAAPADAPAAPTPGMARLTAAGLRAESARREGETVRVEGRARVVRFGNGYALEFRSGGGGAGDDGTLGLALVPGEVAGWAVSDAAGTGALFDVAAVGEVDNFRGGEMRGKLRGRFVVLVSRVERFKEAAAAAGEGE